MGYAYLAVTALYTLEPKPDFERMRTTARDRAADATSFIEWARQDIYYLPNESDEVVLAAITADIDTVEAMWNGKHEPDFHYVNFNINGLNVLVVGGEMYSSSGDGVEEAEPIDHLHELVLLGAGGLRFG